MRDDGRRLEGNWIGGEGGRRCGAMSGVIGGCLRDVMGNWGSVKKVDDRTSSGGGDKW